MAQPSNTRRLRSLCLAACFGSSLALSASAEADTSHLPGLPIIEVESINAHWICDLETLDIYLVDDATAGAGAYYELDGVLYHVGIDDELILGFEDRLYTTMNFHTPAGYSVWSKVDGGSANPTAYHIVDGAYISEVHDNLSTYDFAAQAGYSPDRAPSRGKIRVQSHDRCPPPAKPDA